MKIQFVVDCDRCGVKDYFEIPEDVEDFSTLMDLIKKYANFTRCTVFGGHLVLCEKCMSDYWALDKDIEQCKLNFINNVED